MTRGQGGHDIRTTAEAGEDAAMPRRREVHADPDTAPAPCEVPEELQEPIDGKSPAQWAYERLILYIQDFEDQLDAQHEVAMGFAGGDLGVLRIEGMGFFDPDIVTFFGSDENGTRTQLIQHVSQLNVMLRALPRAPDSPEPTRIGFRLARGLSARSDGGKS